MRPADLRARLATPRQTSSPSPNAAAPIIDNPPSMAAQAGSATADALAERPLIAASVLVPFLQGAHPGVLLTRRTAHLTSHAGQVSFPGGRIDPTDASAEAAALREAHEEIALDPAYVDIVGRLPDYVTGTGFLITPILGLLPEHLDLDQLALRASPDEVDEIFVLPLSVLLDPAAPQRRRTELRGRMREFWVWPHPEHYIWGATAAILVTVAARLRAPDAP
jgi:8-oxo-dGTP pyrophosphatase MutT (NUDIX family)